MDRQFEPWPRVPWKYRVCPFCNEQQFAVYRDTGRWHCHHCQASGTIDQWPGRQGVYPKINVDLDPHGWG